MGMGGGAERQIAGLAQIIWREVPINCFREKY